MSTKENTPFNTPTKKSLHVNITPSKVFCCVVCADNITNPDNRRKLFSGAAKTPVALKFENTLNIHFEQSLGNHVCKRCLRKVDGIIRQQENIKKDCCCMVQQFKENCHTLKARYSAQTSKRLHRSPSSGAKETGLKRLCSLQPLSLFSSSELDGAHAATLSRLHKETQTVFDSSVQCVVSVTYPSSGVRQLKVPEQYEGLVKAIVHHTSVPQAIFSDAHLRAELLQLFSKVVSQEFAGLASRTKPSVLRFCDIKSLTSFKWETLEEEFCERAPTLWRFLRDSTYNPNSAANKYKTPKATVPGICAAAAKLASIFSDDLNVLRKINSLILRAGHARKSVYARLSHSYDCMSYTSTNRLTEDVGKGHERTITEWQQRYDQDIKVEKDLLQQIGESVKGSNDHSSLLKRLKLHRRCMGPGYSFTGDNVDLTVSPRHMSIDHQRRDYHLYQQNAYLNRVSGNELPADAPKEDIKTVNYTTFIPSHEDDQDLMNEFAHLTGHIWAKYIPSLQWYKNHLPLHIKHDHTDKTRKKTSKVRLGVLRKNENRLEDMQDILQFIHKHVPGHSDDLDDQQVPVKCLSGGDYLTFERHKKAQELQADGRTPSAQLQGLVAKMEDFHAQAAWQKVMWHHLYSTKSAKSVGTLYSARNILQARNVTTDPKDNYYAASDLLQKFTEAYLVAGALEFFGMNEVNSDQPSQHVYCGEAGDEAGKKQHVVQTIKEFLNTHISFTWPAFDDPATNNLHCKFCNKQYLRLAALKKHERSVHGHIASQEEESATPRNPYVDGVYDYTRCTLLLGLLRLNQDDAIKMGDGKRLLNVYKYMMLFYKTSGCPKYAYGTLETLAQVHCLLSPRLAEQLTWNRFVNTSGNIDGNYPMDLDVEHDNRLFKENVTTYHGKLTDSILTRACLSVGAMQDILQNYDKTTSIHRPSGKHVDLNSDSDVLALVQKFHQEELFVVKTGRCHASFENVKANPLQLLNADSLKKWFSSSFQTFSSKHYYKQ